MKQNKIDNLETFHKIVKSVDELLGMEFWQFTPSYGGVYNFDFGDKIKVGSRIVGNWWVSTCGTNFSISRKKVLIDTMEIDLDEPHTIIQVNRVLNQLIGKKVTSIQIDYDMLSLLIVLDDEIDLKITPTEEDNDYQEPYWCIQFPNGKLLSIGRERSYSFVDSEN